MKFNELSNKGNFKVGTFAERDSIFSHTRPTLKVTADFGSLFSNRLCAKFEVIFTQISKFIGNETMVVKLV